MNTRSRQIPQKLATRLKFFVDLPEVYPIIKDCNLKIDRYIGLIFGLTNIPVSASVDVDKMLLYASRIQIICARKHVRFHKQADKMNHGECVIAAKTKASSLLD